MTKRLLITGGSGELGRELVPGLSSLGHDVLIGDVSPFPLPLPERTRFQHLDVLGPDLFAAAAGMDAIVHFAGIRTEAPLEAVLATNVLGSIRVLEAARRSGARAIIASTNHVVGQAEVGAELDASALPQPDSFYGWGKAAVELAGRLYHDKHGVESAHLRIGSCFPKPSERRHLATWLSRQDLIRLVHACLSAERIGCAILWGISANTRRCYGEDDAEAVGYRPCDNAEDYAEKIGSVGDAFDEGARQGGAMANQPLPAVQ